MVSHFTYITFHLYNTPRINFPYLNRAHLSTEPNQRHWSSSDSSTIHPRSTTKPSGQAAMAESTSSNKPLVIADPSGDVILVVGERIAHDATLRIQVSSHVLSLVSTVFKAMFSSRYHEGAMLNAAAGQPVTISLPEDRPEAVSLACRMFHYQLDDDVESPTYKLLDKFAMFCDKYDCAYAAQPSIRFWIQPFYNCGGVTGFHDLLVVSYMLDNPIFFGRVTQDLVSRYTGNFMDFVSQHGRNILPSCLCCEYCKSNQPENAPSLITPSRARRKENEAEQPHRSRCPRTH